MDAKLIDAATFDATMSSGKASFHVLGKESQSTTIPVATKSTLGGIKVGENLTITADGVLAVDTTTNATQDNTKPITSGGVYTVVGNIDALLKNI